MTIHENANVFIMKETDVVDAQCRSYKNYSLNDINQLKSYEKKSKEDMPFNSLRKKDQIEELNREGLYEEDREHQKYAQNVAQQRTQDECKQEEFKTKGNAFMKEGKYDDAIEQ